MRLCDPVAVPADLGTHIAKLCSRPWRSHRYSSSVVGRAGNCGVSAVAVLGVVQFLDKVVVPVGAMTGEVAQCFGSTMKYMFQGCFWKNFTIFYMIGKTRLLRSILRPGRHIVDNGSGMFHTGFAGIDLALCFP